MIYAGPTRNLPEVEPETEPVEVEPVEAEPETEPVEVEPVEAEQETEPVEVEPETEPETKPCRN